MELGSQMRMSNTEHESQLEQLLRENTELADKVEFLTQELNDLQAQLDLARSNSGLGSAARPLNQSQLQEEQPPEEARTSTRPPSDAQREAAEANRSQIAASEAREQKMARHLAKKKQNTLKIRHVDCQTDFPKPEPITQVVYVNAGAEEDKQPAPREFQTRATQMSPVHAQAVMETSTISHQKKLSEYPTAEPEQVSVKLLADMR